MCYEDDNVMPPPPGWRGGAFSFLFVPASPHFSQVESWTSQVRPPSPSSRQGGPNTQEPRTGGSSSKQQDRLGTTAARHVQTAWKTPTEGAKCRKDEPTKRVQEQKKATKTGSTLDPSLQPKEVNSARQDLHAMCTAPAEKPMVSRCHRGEKNTRVGNKSPAKQKKGELLARTTLPTRRDGRAAAVSEAVDRLREEPSTHAVAGRGGFSPTTKETAHATAKRATNAQATKATNVVTKDVDPTSSTDEIATQRQVRHRGKETNYRVKVKATTVKNMDARKRIKIPQAAERTEAPSATKAAANGGRLHETMRKGDGHAMVAAGIRKATGWSDSQRADAKHRPRAQECRPKSATVTRKPLPGRTADVSHAYGRNAVTVGGRPPRTKMSLKSLMRQVDDKKLPLGLEPGEGGLVGRYVAKFAVACGFPAVWGPLVLKKAIRILDGGGDSDGREIKTIKHAEQVLSEYWDKELAQSRGSERFFRLVCGDTSDGIVKVHDAWEYLVKLQADVRPFLMAIAKRHPDTVNMSTEEAATYVETVLINIFFKHSNNAGRIRLRDLRAEGGNLATVMAGVGRMTITLEDSDYFSLTRHTKIMSAFRTGRASPVEFQPSAASSSTAGPDTDAKFHAMRVMSDDTLRAFERGECPGGSLQYFSASQSKTAVHPWTHQVLDFSTFVCLYLSDETLRKGAWRERDIRRHFALADKRGRGRGKIDLFAFVGTFIRTDGEEKPLNEVFNAILDSFGVEQSRSHITLEDMLKTNNEGAAVAFFRQLRV